MSSTITANSDYNHLDKQYEVLLSRVLDKAVRDAGAKFMKKYGMVDARVFRIISEKEIMVNSCSDFGVNLGDRLTVWEEGSALTDPHTGLKISPRVKKKVFLRSLKSLRGSLRWPKVAKRLFVPSVRGTRLPFSGLLRSVV